MKRMMTNDGIVRIAAIIVAAGSGVQRAAQDMGASAYAAT